MKYHTRLLLYKKKSIYDDLVISTTDIFKYENRSIPKQVNGSELNPNNGIKVENNFYPILLRQKGLSASLVSAYIWTINHSIPYRKSAVKLLERFIETKLTKLNVKDVVILIKLNTPKKQFLDYKWNDKVTRMVVERQEIEYVMSWLSTLGGAFSALGDQFSSCAKIAGKISVAQFKLAMRLGDPQLVGRCRLYAALSLLQQGHLKVSAQMVKEIFQTAIDIKDIRLKKMCQGVWAKLQYYYSQRKRRRCPSC